jgi:hypothetical protein
MLSTKAVTSKPIPCTNFSPSLRPGTNRYGTTLSIARSKCSRLSVTLPVLCDRSLDDAISPLAIIEASDRKDNQPSRDYNED